MGEPNSGKSSLMNSLARRDVSIVSGEPGTTRDLIEVSLDLGGYRLVLVDTAGIRQVPVGVEREGIRRALQRAQYADLVVWLQPVDVAALPDLPDPGAPVIVVRSKDDSGAFRSGSVSVRRSDGLDWFIAELASRAAGGSAGAETGIVTRGRHRSALASCEGLLREATAQAPLPFEVRAELLRRASDEIGRLTGRIDVEDLLERIFSEFCIGK
jgi:tRNA modification GTPase